MMAFSGFQDFNPDFSNALQNMIAARPGISVYSGYRSPERQAQLYAAAIQKYGSPEAARHWVAPPGHSRHNMGIAADLSFASDEDKAWAHENAGQYGLNFRMGHEPWHIELVGGENGQKPQAVAVSNETGKPVAPPPEEQKQLYDPNYKQPIANPGAMPIQIQDVNALANLLGNRSPRKDLLESIKGYS